MALVIWPVAFGAIHGGVPLALARIDGRHGWRGDRPGFANVLGLPFLAFGLVLIVWALARHFQTAPGKSWEIKVTLEPEYLLVEGPYRLTRNPMYVGAQAIWGGWAIFLGSVATTVGFVFVTIGLHVAVAVEEAGLQRRYGDEWRAWAARTPRWWRFRRA